MYRNKDIQIKLENFWLTISYKEVILHCFVFLLSYVIETPLRNLGNFPTVTNHNN